MAKKNKMISLSEDILKHIDENLLIPNFSEWVENEYKSSFLVETKLKEELKLVYEKAHLLEKTIKNLSKKDVIFDKKEKKIDKKMLELFENIKNPLRIGYLSVKKGFDETAILKRLNFEYGIDWSKKQFHAYIEEFKELLK